MTPKFGQLSLVIVAGVLSLTGCGERANQSAAFPQPTEIVDLGAVITEDMPARTVGKKLLGDFGFDRPNAFEVIPWELEEGRVKGLDSYYTFFNHGSGPHVDAPNHIGLGGGLDTLPAEAFAGPVKVADVTAFESGWTVTRAFLEGLDIRPGDIFIIYTDYRPPASDEDYPEIIALTREAAIYLAELPVRAFGTDAVSVASLSGETGIESDDPTVRHFPVHEAFLSRGIPVYEALYNVDKLLGKDSLYFVGPPINVKDGDGMLARPLVFVFD